MTETEKWKTGADNMARMYEELKRKCAELTAQLAEATRQRLVLCDALEKCVTQRDEADKRAELAEAQLAEANARDDYWKQWMRTVAERDRLAVLLNAVEALTINGDREAVLEIRALLNAARQAALNPEQTHWTPADGWKAGEDAKEACEDAARRKLESLGITV